MNNQDERPIKVGGLDIGELRAAYSRDVYQYWLDCKGEGTAPSVDVIDPLRLPRQALPYIAIYDVEYDPLRFRGRLDGAAVVEEIGIDSKGLYVDEQIRRQDQIARLKNCALSCRPYIYTGQVTWTSRDYKHYTVLGLPFIGDQDRVTRLLMVFEFW